MKRFLKKRSLALLALAALCGCGASAPAAPAASPTPAVEARLSLDLLSTGKSDCALLCMDELVIFSDTADRDDLAAIEAALTRRGVERIDCIILSHYDRDHIGSAPELLRRWEVGRLLGPAYREDSEEYLALEAAARDMGVPWERVEADMAIETAHGSLLLDPPDRDYGDDNNNSLLLTVRWQGRSLLFLGDARKKRMEEFLAVAEEGYDFVKLPHHGDSNKPLERLLAAAPPSWAAVTVGEHEVVDEDLVALLEAAGSQLFCTRDGPVELLWTGETLQAEQRRP